MKTTLRLLSLCSCLSFSFSATIPIKTVYADRLLAEYDKDNDGILTEKESGPRWNGFKHFDKDTSKTLNKEELEQMPLPYLETGEQRMLNVLYKNTAHEPLYLDVYLPKESFQKPRPLVVYTHGGGWAAGNKQSAANPLYAPVFKKLVAEGFVVASVNYRLWGIHGDSTAETCLIDCKDAIRHLVSIKGEININPEKVFVLGGSAGGHLAQMITLSPPHTFAGDPSLADQPYNIVAGVAWYGFTNLLEDSLYNTEANPHARLGTIARVVRPDLSEIEKQQRLLAISPTTYLHPENAPLLVIHGDLDKAVSVNHAYYIDKKAKETGAPVTVKISNHAGHCWSKPTEKALTPSLSEIQDMTANYILKHYKK